MLKSISEANPRNQLQLTVDQLEKSSPSPIKMNGILADTYYTLIHELTPFYNKVLQLHNKANCGDGKIGQNHFDVDAERKDFYKNWFLSLVRDRKYIRPMVIL